MFWYIYIDVSMCHLLGQSTLPYSKCSVCVMYCNIPYKATQFLSLLLRVDVVMYLCVCLLVAKASVKICSQNYNTLWFLTSEFWIWWQIINPWRSCVLNNECHVIFWKYFEKVDYAKYIEFIQYLNNDMPLNCDKTFTSFKKIVFDQYQIKKITVNFTFMTEFIRYIYMEISIYRIL